MNTLYNNQIFLNLLSIEAYMVIRSSEYYKILPTTVVAVDHFVYLAQNPCFHLSRRLTACTSPRAQKTKLTLKPNWYIPKAHP